MSDSFSAPITKERREFLADRTESTTDEIRAVIRNEVPDSIALHHIADELEGLAMLYRTEVENAIECYVMAKNAGVA